MNETSSSIRANHSHYYPLSEPLFIEGTSTYHNSDWSDVTISGDLGDVTIRMVESTRGGVLCHQVVFCTHLDIAGDDIADYALGVILASVEFLGSETFRGHVRW